MTLAEPIQLPALAKREPRLVEQLPQPVIDALIGLPYGREAIQFRHEGIAARGKLSAVLRALDQQRDASTISDRHHAELLAWIAHLGIIRGYRDSTTLVQYAGSVARFLGWALASDVDYTDAALADLDRWMAWLALELRNGVSWRIRQLAAVRAFYDWRATRILGRNCALGMRGPREPTKMPRKYSLAQLQAMLNATRLRRTEALRLRDRALLLLLLSSGMRREEICRLDLRDVELGKRTGLLHIEGKGAKQRQVSMEGPVVEALTAWLMERDRLPFPIERAPFFVGVEGQRGRRMSLRALEGMVGFHAKQAGIADYGVHRFRVNFATALYDDGVEIEEIRILLGHESIETTRNYLAVSERARKTRLRADRQHEMLGTRNKGQARWVRAALGQGVGNA